MIDDDRREFALMLRDVYLFYGKDKEFSDTAVDIWWQAMKPFDFAAVRESFGRHAVNPDKGSFMPKPADIVRMMGGSTLDSAMVALSEFERALSEVGTYMTVVFEDPLIHVVVDEMGGWVQLGHVTSKDWEFRRNEFLNRYRSYKSRSETPPFRPRLIGICDGENATKGYKVDDTYLRLIGDAATCKRVMALGSDSAGRLSITTGPQLALKAQAALEHKS